MAIYLSTSIVSSGNSFQLFQIFGFFSFECISFEIFEIFEPIKKVFRTELREKVFLCATVCTTSGKVEVIYIFLMFFFDQNIIVLGPKKFWSR